MTRRRRSLYALAAICSACLLGAAVGRLASSEKSQMHIRWREDVDAARQEAKRAGRPMMVLSRPRSESDVSRAFAAGPLSHPIVVDAADEFVTIVQIDPSASSPAVRFLGADGKELIPNAPSTNRADGPSVTTAELSTARLLIRMADALRTSGRPVPAYLDLVAREYNPPARETATFAVTCYWSGEKLLGRLDGVIATRTGMLGSEEVVEVDFDPGAIGYAALAEQATGMTCFRKAYAHSPAQQAAAAKLTDRVEARPARPMDTSNQQQFHLSMQPTYHFLPLTSLQATKVNAALVAGEPPERFLSPGQIALQQRMAKLLEKDRHALIDLEQSLKPDRSTEGLPAYAAEIERRVNRLAR